MRQEGEKQMLMMKQHLVEEQIKAKRREEDIKELKRYIPTSLQHACIILCINFVHHDG